MGHGNKLKTPRESSNERVKTHMINNLKENIK